MKNRPVVGLVASVVVHVALVLVVLLLVPRAEVLPPLLVDLTRAARTDDGQTPGAAMPAPRPAADAPAVTDRPAGRVAAPRRQTPRPAPSVSGAPSASPAQSVSRAPSAEAPASAPASEAPDAPSTPPPALSPKPAPTIPSTGSAATPQLRAPGVASSQPLAPRVAADPSNASPGGGASSASGSGGDATGAGDTARASMDRGSGDAGPVVGAPTRGPGGIDVARATPGAGGGEAGEEYGAYLGRLRARIQETLRYPAAARRRGLAGTVVLELTIQPSGSVGDVAVLESSSHAVLDAAAVDAVRALRPQPIPRELPQRALRVRLPVVFDLR